MLFLISFSTKANENRDEYILILSSYAYDNDWSTSIAKTLQHKLKEKVPEIIVNISYAGIDDSNTFLGGRLGVKAALANGRIGITDKAPLLLVLIGDESWMHYRTMEMDDYWKKDIPVVLVGVNSQVMENYSEFYPEKYLDSSQLIPIVNTQKKSFVISITKKDNETSTLNLIKNLLPDTKKISFISSRNYQDKYVQNELKKVFRNQFSDMQLNIIEINDRKLHRSQELNEQVKNSVVLVNSVEIPEKNFENIIFSLKHQPHLADNYMGGYYSSDEEFVSLTFQIILRILNGESPHSIPTTTETGDTPYLNKKALIAERLSRGASQIPFVKFINEPQPFLVKNMRNILVISLFIVILVILITLHLRNRRQRIHITDLSKKYEQVYEEYEIINENMPVGLVLFDRKGNQLSFNPEAKMFFDMLPGNEFLQFNLYKTSFLDNESKEKIRRRRIVNRIFRINNLFLRIIIRVIKDEISENENILMIIIDNTNIEKEKQAKERIHKIFRFAMDKSSLGVAEYNLIDKSGFATQAWYKNLFRKEDDNFSDVHSTLIPEDRTKLKTFLKELKNGKANYFEDTIRIMDGDSFHWVKYIIQLLEFAPQKRRIIVAELVLNIDEQKKRESELFEALEIAKESDRLKNAFIANMTNDIRPYLNELVELSTKLTETYNKNEMAELLTRIQADNDILLQFINKIIEASQNGLKN